MVGRRRGRLHQAYRPETACAAATTGRLGGFGFSFNRTSWVKPNFLWMMYRSGWASKPGQERVLALRVARTGFDGLLERAVHSSPRPDLHTDEGDWRRALRASGVVLQWDPDRSPRGEPLNRRALQLGLRGPALRAFVERFVLGIEDITPFVMPQRANRDDPDALLTPREFPYPLTPVAERRLGTGASRGAQPDPERWRSTPSQSGCGR